METLKKFGALLALLVALIGTVWAYVCVIKAEDTIVPLVGLVVLTAFAIPAVVHLFNFLCDRVERIPLEIGDEFTTDKGEKFKVIKFDEDRVPICERIE